MQNEQEEIMRAGEGNIASNDIPTAPTAPATERADVECVCGTEDPRSARHGNNHLAWCPVANPARPCGTQGVFCVPSSIDGWCLFCGQPSAASSNEMERLCAEVKRLEQWYDERTAQRDAALSAAKHATNGWACYARTKKEHAEIARLHGVIAKLEGK
jgi:hypothetical protein